MDNMAAGWDRPQEDEFALMNLGNPSPYRRIAFPNEPPVDLDYLDFADVSESEIQKWLNSLRRFLLSVSASTGRPLIIKSPTHTGRIAWLAREFPDATWIAIIKKTNKYVNLLNRYMGFTAIAPDDEAFSAAAKYFNNASAEDFNYVQLVNRGQTLSAL